MLPLRGSQRFFVRLYFGFHFPPTISQTCSLLPSNRNRSTIVHALVTAFNLIRSPPDEASYVVSLLRPSPASESDLTAYHDRSYVDALLADAPDTDRMNRNEFGLEGVCAILLAFPFCADHTL
jgi:histone deacetylase 8